MDWENLISKAEEARKEEHFEKSEKLLIRALESLDDCSKGDARVISILKTLSELQWQQGKFSKVAEYLSQLLYSEERAFGIGSRETTVTLKFLAEAHYNLKEYEKSQIYCRKMYAIKRKVYGDQNVEVFIDAHTLAVLYHTGGQYDLAEPLYKESIAVLTKQLGDNHEIVKSILSNYAGLLTNLHRNGEAEHLLQSSMTGSDQR
jgi:tetratricopeptide (TPR) repeat protein